jgi:hypothetical protein
MSLLDGIRLQRWSTFRLSPLAAWIASGLVLLLTPTFPLAA